MNKSMLAVAAVATCTVIAIPRFFDFDDEITWVGYTSPDGSYSVDLPDQPELQSQPLGVPGVNMSLELAIAETKFGAFCVGYSDYPEQVVQLVSSEEIFDGSREAWLRMCSGSLVSETPIEVGGYPAREFHARGKVGPAGKIDADMHARVFLRDSRLFLMQYVGEEGRLTPGELRSFYDSFRLH